jgi:hypothetical protein
LCKYLSSTTTSKRFSFCSLNDGGHGHGGGHCVRRAVICSFVDENSMNVQWWQLVGWLVG